MIYKKLKQPGIPLVYKTSIKYYSNNKYRLHFQCAVAAITLMILFTSCASTEETTVGTKDQSEQETVSKQANKQQELNLDSYLSSLRDTYISSQHEIPEGFLTYRKNEENDEANNRNGYRIQIISTRDVSKADSVSQKFQIWSDSLDTYYKPQPYIIFRQPYFRVHVGDFQKRDTAITYSSIIKQEFPGAWVVHDRINLKYTPKAVKARQDSVQTDSTAQVQIDSTRIDNMPQQ